MHNENISSTFHYSVELTKKQCIPYSDKVDLSDDIEACKNTLIHYVLLAKQQELENFFARNNANDIVILNEPLFKGYTLLQYAIKLYACTQNTEREELRSLRYQIIKLLIDNHNVNVSIKSSRGKTALYYASENNLTDIVILLLQVGADPYEVDERILTISQDILALLTEARHSAFAEVLQKFKEKVEKGNKCNNSELYNLFIKIISSESDEQIKNKRYRGLLNIFNVNKKELLNQTSDDNILTYAVKNACISTLKKLTQIYKQEQINILWNKANTRNKTLLHLALEKPISSDIETGNVTDVIMFLLESNVDLYYQSQNQTAPICLILGTELPIRTAVFEKIGKNLNVNFFSIHEQPLLFVAAISGNYDMVKVLLQHEKIITKITNLKGQTVIDYMLYEINKSLKFLSTQDVDILKANLNNIQQYRNTVYNLQKNNRLTTVLLKISKYRYILQLLNQYQIPYKQTQDHNISLLTDGILSSQPIIIKYTDDIDNNDRYNKTDEIIKQVLKDLVEKYKDSGCWLLDKVVMILLQYCKNISEMEQLVGGIVHMYGADYFLYQLYSETKYYSDFAEYNKKSNENNDPNDEANINKIRKYFYRDLLKLNINVDDCEINALVFIDLMALLQHVLYRHIDVENPFLANIFLRPYLVHGNNDLRNNLKILTFNGNMDEILLNTTKELLNELNNMVVNFEEQTYIDAKVVEKIQDNKDNNIKRKVEEIINRIQPIQDLQSALSRNLLIGAFSGGYGIVYAQQIIKHANSGENLIRKVDSIDLLVEDEWDLCKTPYKIDCQQLQRLEKKFGINLRYLFALVSAIQTFCVRHGDFSDLKKWVKDTLVQERERLKQQMQQDLSEIEQECNEFAHTIEVHAISSNIMHGTNIEGTSSRPALRCM